MSRKHRGTAPKRLLAPQPERDPWLAYLENDYERQAQDMGDESARVPANRDRLGHTRTQHTGE